MQPSRRLRLASVLGVLLLATVLGASPSGATRADTQADPHDPNTVSTSELTLGVTHGQYSADPWDDPGSVESAKAVLRASAPLQNQHIMGWGAGSPEPSPGVYDWSSLDRRIALIRSTGGTPVITLCCAPDWMKGGRAGTTDWSRLAVAPTPDHFADFAALAAAVAQRYPDVGTFLVWNELKGFWDTRANRWDAAAYTDLYNAVYTAVKQVRPDAKIGGPYVVMDSWAPASAGVTRSAVQGAWGFVDPRALDVVTYWLQHKVGADFLVVDGTSLNRDRDVVDPLASTEKFAAVTTWLRGQSDLPVWWSEWYVQPTRGGFDAQTLVSAQAAALVRFIQSGASVALLWQPQQLDDGNQGWLWSEAHTQGGGRPSILSWVFDALIANFAPGTRLEPAELPPGVLGVVSKRGALLVNTTSEPVKASLFGRDQMVGPRGIALVWA